MDIGRRASKQHKTLQQAKDEYYYINACPLPVRGGMVRVLDGRYPKYT